MNNRISSSQETELQNWLQENVIFLQQNDQ